MKAADTLTVDTLFSDPLQYKKLLENNSIAFILGVNGKTILHNHAAAQLFGYTKNEFTGVHRDQLFVNDAAYQAALYKRSIGESKVGELTGVRKDGTQFACEVYSTIFTDIDNIVKSSTAIVEISRHKELERKAQLSELLLNNIDQTFVLIGKDLSVLNFTDSARREIKAILNVDIFIGDSILKISSNERKPVLKQYIEDALAGKRSIYHTNYEVKGRRFFYESHFKPIYNEHQEIYAVLLTAVNITEKVLAESALEETEKRWRFALEGSNQGVWDWDIPSGKTYYSPTWKKILGFEQNEVVNHIDDWKRLLHQDDALKMEREISQHLVSENAYHETIHRLRNKKGEYRWILARGMIVSNDEHGNPVRMIGTHTDITDQKSIQQGYQHLFYNHPLPMWIYNKESLRIEDVNEAALSHYGYSKNEFLALTIEQLRPKEDVSILHQHINSIIPGETAKYIVRHLKKDGTIIYSEVIGNNLEYNGRKCRMISANDITDKINTENELRDSNERFELAVNATSDAIWDWNIQTSAIYWGKSLSTLFGYRQNLNKKEWIANIHPQDQEKVEYSLMMTVFQSNKNHWTEEYRFKDIHGNYRFVLDRGFIVRNEQNKPVRMIGAMQDITDRKLKEQELEHSNERFEIASRATSDIVWDWDLTSNQIELADNYTLTFGVSIPADKKISPDLFTERIHPDDVRKWKSNITATLVNAKNVKFEEEFRFRRSDETYAFIIIRGYILRNEQGKAIRIIGAISDISEKKYHQELLALELRVFETSAIQNISFKNVLKTFLHGFEYLHPAVLSVLVFPDEQSEKLIAAKNLDKIPLSISDLIARQVKAMGGPGKKHLLVSDLTGDDWAEYHDLIQENKWKVLWVIPVQHADGNDLGYFTLFQKEALVPTEDQLNTLLRLRNLLRILIINNQSLRQVKVSNERYDMVLQATNDMIWDWNLEKGNLYRNEEGVRKVYGINDSMQIQNMDDWMKRIHPEDQGRVSCIINNILNSVEMDKFEIEYRFKRDDGNYSHVYDRGIVIKNESGKPLRLIGAAQNISERKKLEEELVRKELERQKAINQASVDSQEHERREIGRELHDNVNQILTTTRLYLDLSLSNQDMKDDLILKSSDNINYVINEIRQLSRSLMDPSLGDLGLIDSLNDLIESINITKKLSVSLHADCNLDNYIEPNQKLAVFRIVQEALSNIIKHAQANKATIQLERKKKIVELSIKDNGKGFDLQTVKKGAGIKNIQNRAYLMNGLISIDSALGKGCSINIQFPINQTN